LIVVSVIAISHSFTLTKCRRSTLFLVITFTCWCMASVLVISLSLQQRAECCHLAMLCCTVGPVLSCLFSLRLYTTDNTVSLSLSQLYICFFGHLLACCHLVLLQCVVCSVHNCFFGLSTCPTDNTEHGSIGYCGNQGVAYWITNLSFMLLSHVSLGLCFMEHWQTACTWSYSVRFWWWMAYYIWPYSPCGHFPSSDVLEINVIYSTLHFEGRIGPHLQASF
jgi:hypothetical protein